MRIPFTWESQSRLEEPLLMFENCVLTCDVGRYRMGERIDLIVIDTEKWSMELFHDEVSVANFVLALTVMAERTANHLILEPRKAA